MLERFLTVFLLIMEGQVWGKNYEAQQASWVCKVCRVTLRPDNQSKHDDYLGSAGKAT